MMSLSQDNQQQSIYTLTSYITSPNKNGTPAKTAHTTDTIVNNRFNHTKPQTLSKAIGIGKLKFKNGLNNKNYKSKTHTTTTHNLKKHYGCEGGVNNANVNINEKVFKIIITNFKIIKFRETLCIYNIGFFIKSCMLIR
eukprot:343758_1